MTDTIRVAAAQFAIGSDLDENLATVIRMIDRAAEESPDVVVLPEFCNHLSVYDSADHAWDVAIDDDGPWIEAVGARAAAHGMWVQLNCTLRRERPVITNTNFLFGPDGSLASVNDKTVLMGAEGDYLSPATEMADLTATPFGAVGNYACMDGVITEVPRGLVVRGSRLLLNSLNSFALDEASLHIPVRAAENKVWLVACCKTGPLLPDDKVEMFSQAMGVPGEFLRGAGESQIVDPDGTVVAQAPRDGEAVIVADIDLTRSDDKRRPDGTDVFAARRPEVYRALAEPTPPLGDHARAEECTVAAVGVAPGATVVELTAQLEAAVAEGADLVVFPEQPHLGLDDLIDPLAAVAGDTIVVVSGRSEGAHTAVAVSGSGELGRQDQIHASARFGQWQDRLGDEFTPVDTRIGRLGLVVGDDAVFPEVARLAALASCDVVAVPFTQQESWETSMGLVERAAENRVCLVAANAAGENVIVDLPPDFTLWATSRHRSFDGTINDPDVIRGSEEPGVTTSVIHPARSVNRQISKGTNLVDGRPWALCGPLVSPR